MNILLFEDSGRISYPMEDYLIQKGHTVFNAGTIEEAKEFWENEHIDCIITDLSIDPEGLTPEEITQTKDGLFTGWVWINEYVFSSNPSMKQRTIIFSDYVNNLKSSDISKELPDNIRIISKNSNQSSAYIIEQEIKKIVEEMLKEGK